jgi:hypothetical protein
MPLSGVRGAAGAHSNFFDAGDLEVALDDEPTDTDS